MNTERPVLRVLSMLSATKRTDGGWSARCPAHEDHSPSLSVGEGADGRVLLTCHAGCSLDDILAALGLSTSDLFANDSAPPADRRTEVEAYDYTDEDSTLLYQVVRFAPKAFRQRRRDAGGDWVWNLRGTRRVLYRLPAVLAAAARGDTIYVVEGEKDVAALEAVGEIATCNSCGAGKWREEYAEAVRGAHVVVVADRDQAGRKHAGDVADSVARAAASVRIVEPIEGKDAYDHLVVGGRSVDEFVDVGGDDVTPPIDEDGAALLDELHAAVTRYVVLPSAEAADAVTLWIAASHAQPAWNHAPRLCAVSPIKQCGKSRLMDVVHATCHQPLITVNASIAAVVRSIGDREPITLLVDEADTIFGTKKAAENNEDLRGILNAGHQRNRPYLRWDLASRQTEHTPTFAMAMLAAIRDLPDTIMDRAVVIRMRRRAPGESIASWRERTAPASLRDLRERLHAYLRSNIDELAAAEPAMPVEDRAADTWEPLVAVADLAQGTWPERARRACILMSSGEPDDGEVGERLLSDVRDVFWSQERIKTAVLLERLWALDEAPWADWHGKPLTARGLRMLLRPYGVKSKNLRFASDDQAKGYEAADFADAWQRYLRVPAVPSVPASHDAETAGRSRDGCGTLRDPAIRPSPDQRVHYGRDAGTDGTAQVRGGDGSEQPRGQEGRTHEEAELDAAVQLVLAQFPGSQVVDNHNNDLSGIGNGHAERVAPRGPELFAIAAGMDYPRTDLADGTTVLAGEASWQTFCAVALPHDRRQAMDALRRCEMAVSA